MNHPKIERVNTVLLNNFSFTPTAHQKEALHGIAAFLCQYNKQVAFLLKGFAGTGKTTLIDALVHTLPLFNLKAVLLAPTGRAAKVMSRYAGAPAFTIHRFIYRMRAHGGSAHFERRANRANHTVYIVDEASMISDSSRSGAINGSSLLQDLLDFVQEGANCKILMAGDSAQLPPVDTELSPALDGDYLRTSYGFQSREVMLKEVLRQAAQSVILKNATALRQMMPDHVALPRFELGGDFGRLVEAYEMEETLQNAYQNYDRDQIAVIVRSNKRANMFNQQIRQRILWQEDELSAGDQLMVVKNNYFWLPEQSQAGFIANGDIVEVRRIFEITELYGYRFARCELRLVDYPEEPPLEAQLLLDVLQMEGPSQSWDQTKAFFETVLEDYADLPTKVERQREVRKNPYFNALQVKFAYAFTCHKAQGGQWPVVFVEKPWLPDGTIDLDYLRWLYTAFTRAQEQLWVLGFENEYFGELIS